MLPPVTVILVVAQPPSVPGRRRRTGAPASAPGTCTLLRGGGPVRSICAESHAKPSRLWSKEGGLPEQRQVAQVDRGSPSTVIHRSRATRSSLSRTGLVRYVSIPRAVAASLSPSNARALSPMIGVRVR